MTEGKHPYQHAHTQIVLDELTITDVQTNGKQIIIKGDGFNQSSKSYVEHHELATQFIDANTLMTEDPLPEGGLVIKQLGRNNIPLLDSNIFTFE